MLGCTGAQQVKDYGIIAWAPGLKKVEGQLEFHGSITRFYASLELREGRRIALLSCWPSCGTDGLRKNDKEKCLSEEREWARATDKSTHGTLR